VVHDSKSTYNTLQIPEKAQLRMKLQMAQFLQDTIKEMAVSGKNA